MAEKLYTFVLEYREGTYIAQVLADSPTGAPSKWISVLKDEDLSRWKITREELATVIKSDHLTPLNGCLGVWCLTGSVRNSLVLINVIATEQAS